MVLYRVDIHLYVTHIIAKWWMCVPYRLPTYTRHCSNDKKTEPNVLYVENGKWVIAQNWKVAWREGSRMSSNEKKRASERAKENEICNSIEKNYNNEINWFQTQKYTQLHCDNCLWVLFFLLSVVARLLYECVRPRIAHEKSLCGHNRCNTIFMRDDTCHVVSCAKKNL